jgi:hypothetical protein
VIYADSEPRALPGAKLPGASPMPPPFALTSEEGSAILAFGERAATLSPERRDELAGLAAPLISPGEAPAASLLRIAAFLRGGEPTA